MARGVSIHIGINTIDENHYGTSFKPLNSCEKDARNMKVLADRQGFSSILLIEKPTAEDVINTIRSFAAKNDENPNINPNIKPLVSGDMLLITYSGHGSTVPDINSDRTWANEELSGDQTWCLWNRQILDDELAQLWSLFDEGVRILFISDSCHSGTVLAEFFNGDDRRNLVAAISFKETLIPIIHNFKNKINFILTKIGLFRQKGGFRMLDEPNNVFQGNLDSVYIELLEKLEKAFTAKKSKPENINSNAKNFKDFIKASIVSITACQDGEKALDGKDKNFNGVFTAALEKVWFGTDDARYWQEVKFVCHEEINASCYEQFFLKAREETYKQNSGQTPNLTTIPENIFKEDWNAFLNKVGNEHLKAFMHKKPFEL
jgi:metacaspase-1